MKASAALVLLAGLCLGQNFPAAKRTNPALDPPRLLIGNWAEGTATVDFHYAAGGQIIVGNARPNGQSTSPMEMLVLYSEGAQNEIRADSFGRDRQVVHYRLESADARTIRLVSNGSGRRLTYERLDPNHLLYRFEAWQTGRPGSTLASGVLTRNAGLIQPLSE